MTAVTLAGVEPADLDIMLALRIRGPQTTGDIARLLDSRRRAVDDRVAVLVRHAVVEPVGSAWRITRSGRTVCDNLLAELRTTVVVAALDRLYVKFVPLNDRIKAVLTTWQLRSVPGGGFLINTHDDPAYDDSVMARLAEAHAHAQGWLAEIATLIPTFGRRTALLNDALYRAKAGQTEYVMSPWVNSYHSIWFEVHEELLLRHGCRPMDPSR